MNKTKNGQKCLEIDKNCRQCGSPCIFSHHIIYRSQGGTDELWNLIALCDYCHEKVHIGLSPKVTGSKYLSGRKWMIRILERYEDREDFRWARALEELRKYE